MLLKCLEKSSDQTVVACRYLVVFLCSFTHELHAPSACYPAFGCWIIYFFCSEKKGRGKKRQQTCRFSSFFLFVVCSLLLCVKSHHCAMCCRLTTQFQLKTECETLYHSSVLKDWGSVFVWYFFFLLFFRYLFVSEFWNVNLVSVLIFDVMFIWCHLNHEAIPNTPVYVVMVWLSSLSQLTVDG